MSPKLRVLGGSDLITILSSFGFVVGGQKGSHLKLFRINEEGDKETLLVPNHKTIARGTLRAIVRQASAYIPREELEKHLRG